jgi:hypothetical protein
MRAIYILPLVAFVGGAVGLGFTVLRWRTRGQQAVAAQQQLGQPTNAPRDDYDWRLDDELSGLDD